MPIEERLTAQEKRILAQASQIINRIRTEKVSPARRKEISVAAHARSLEVRRANAARRKAEKEGKE